MRGLDKRISGLPRGSTSQHHLTGAGEFSTGEMGNFQPALTPPGKQSAPMTLQGAAFIEVRSGSGALQTGGQRQDLQSGAMVAVSQDQSFTIANSGEFMLTLRVYIVTGS